MVEQRTALANQLRSLFAEYGFIIPVGNQHLQFSSSYLNLLKTHLIVVPPVFSTTTNEDLQPVAQMDTSV